MSDYIVKSGVYIVNDPNHKYGSRPLMSQTIDDSNYALFNGMIINTPCVEETTEQLRDILRKNHMMDISLSSDGMIVCSPMFNIDELVYEYNLDFLINCVYTIYFCGLFIKKSSHDDVNKLLSEIVLEKSKHATICNYGYIIHDPSDDLILLVKSSTHCNPCIIYNPSNVMTNIVNSYKCLNNTY